MTYRNQLLELCKLIAPHGSVMWVAPNRIRFQFYRGTHVWVSLKDGHTLTEVWSSDVGFTTSDGNLRIAFAEAVDLLEIEYHNKEVSRMAKLYFRYGAMNSGKSTQLLQVAFNYEERHQRVLVWKSALDNRDGLDIIRPRIGIERKVDHLLQPDSKVLSLVVPSLGGLSCILIDEAQFLTEAQILDLTDVVDRMKIPVMCYGIRTDAFGKLFPGSAALMALADSIEEIKTICWCGRKATWNARLNPDGTVTREGSQIDVGHHYISLCRPCYKLGKTHP